LIIEGSLRVAGASLNYTVEPHPHGAGRAALSAMWPDTRCSPLPCRVTLEQWRDGMWRAPHSPEGHGTSVQAAESYLRDRVS